MSIESNILSTNNAWNFLPYIPMQLARLVINNEKEVPRCLSSLAVGCVGTRSLLFSHGQL